MAEEEGDEVLGREGGRVSGRRDPWKELLRRLRLRRARLLKERYTSPDGARLACLLCWRRLRNRPADVAQHFAVEHPGEYERVTEQVLGEEMARRGYLPAGVVEAMWPSNGKRIPWRRVGAGRRGFYMPEGD